MKEIKLNLDESKKYVVACSFGPDSMALLDAAIKEKLNLVVAHVNYRKRDAAEQETKDLKNFCEKNNIKLFVLDLLGVHHKGNFQEWAREKRYEFFKQVCDKEHADAVLVAHQQDDAIETYLMQKKRRNFVKKYGISRENHIFNVNVIRPLLEYTKADLIDYDRSNKIPFSIDESNLQNDYTRNKIRHEIVEKLTFEQRKRILSEMKKSEQEQFEIKTFYSKTEFLTFNYRQIVQIFDWYMTKTDQHRDISEKFVDEIKKAIKAKANIQFKISDSVMLESDYEEIVFVNLNRLTEYKFEFETVLQNDLFDIDFSKGAEDRGISKNTRKFIIRNIKKNEKIIIKNYSCTIRRLFIDWKVPLYLREVWPGIYDEDGNLIYVPRYRKVFKDEHISKFKFNTKYFTDF